LEGRGASEIYSLSADNHIYIINCIEKIQDSQQLTTQLFSGAFTGMLHSTMELDFVVDGAPSFLHDTRTILTDTLALQLTVMWGEQ